MKVLILTAKFGMGHMSASNSIMENIIKNNKCAKVKVVDLYDYAMPTLSKYIYKSFSFIIKYTKGMYGKFYLENDKEKDVDLFAKFIAKKASVLLKEEKPDMVVSTFPVISKAIGYYKHISGSKFKLITCITDVSSHYEWIDRDTDNYIVPCEETKKELIKKGVDMDKISVYGIPVSSKYVENNIKLRNKVRGRKVISLYNYKNKKKKEVLIMGGGLGVLPNDHKFYERLHSIENMHFTIVAGRNKQLYEMINNKYDNITALGFSNNVAELMEKADCVLTKPGGITVFEAIYSLTPIISFSTTLPNEVKNINFIIDNNFGISLNGSAEVNVERIERFINSTDRLNSIKSSMSTFVDGLDKDFFINMENEIVEEEKIMRINE